MDLTGDQSDFFKKQQIINDSVSYLDFHNIFTFDTNYSTFDNSLIYDSISGEIVVLFLDVAVLRVLDLDIVTI